MKKLTIILLLFIPISFFAQRTITLDSLVRDTTYVRKRWSSVYEYQYYTDENGKKVTVQKKITDTASFIADIAGDTIPLHDELMMIKEEFNMISDQYNQLKKRKKKIKKKLRKYKKRIANIRNYFNR